MATVNHAFSPKEFQVWIVSDTTNAGASGIHASNMYQLDVDSASMPSLNVNQVLDVRSGVGRTLKDEDFFQDNILRVTELSISGNMHLDAGHKLLMQNVCNDVSGDASVATGFTPASQLYGSAVTNSASSLTVVIRPSDHTNQTSLEIPGLVVTNFALSADAGEEGGRYKFSATLQSGVKPDLNETAEDNNEPTAGANVYANTTNVFMSSASGLKVYNTDVVMQSFTATIDSPAVFSGVTSTGYELVTRGAETAVTVETQVKYDGNTKGFINTFDTQTAPRTGDNANVFVMVNNNAYGIDVQNGVFTNVAYAEGDVMMLDCSIKSVDDGSDALITFDISA
tara:strand:+ start:785 stop:1804 length:1020 start_codon:yes stop_codon:yes gene_type:complete